MKDDTKRILRLHTDLSRVMTDERFGDGRRKGDELRAFVIAYLWARFEGGDRETLWERWQQLAGLTPRSPVERRSHYRLRELYSADAPRFEPVDLHRWHLPCPVPMLAGPRKGEPCGKRDSQSFRVTDPATGEWSLVGYCSRHKAEAVTARRHERAAVVTVEPFPNVGGLLPCYIRASNWPDIYLSADSSWKPPSVGIAADDWPVMQRVVAVQRPRFEAIQGDGEDTGTDAPTPPPLRLVAQ